MSMMPDVFDDMCDENVDWTEATTASHLWTGVEDWFVRTLMEFS